MWIKTSLDYGNFEYDSNTNVYFIKQNCFIKAPKNLILNNEKNKTINYNKISLMSNQPKFLIKYTTGYYHTLMDFFGYIINAVEISKKLNIKPRGCSFNIGNYLLENPAAIDMIENNMHKFDNWSSLSLNPNALHILEKRLDIID